MTLALRLLLAFGLLTFASTAVVGYRVREDRREREERRFDEQLDSATSGALKLMSREAARMRGVLDPVCEHDAFVDSTLVQLVSGGIDAGRRLANTQLVREQMNALKLDELTMFTGTGEVLGAGHDAAAAGKRDPSLADGGKGLRLRLGPMPALVVGCTKTMDAQKVGMVGALYLKPMLAWIGDAYGVRLAIDDGSKRPRKGDVAERTKEAPEPELKGLRLVATIPRDRLVRELAELDTLVLVTSGAAMVVAIAIAILLARSLAGPIAALAVQAREVAHGEPRPVHARGGREMKELALAFNRAIADLVALRKELARTERVAARREVARQVAHEIKNPLAPIRAAVETLRRLRAREDPAFEEYFDEATRTVLDEVHRISRIVSEFSEYARLPLPKPEAVQLDELARSLLPVYAAGGAAITVDGGPCPTVQADKDQITQVLTNLIKNGIEAAEGTGAPAKIDIRIDPAGPNDVALVVSDDGPGVSPELIPRLFEPYATGKTGGTGLGLAIVRRIVEEHGGEIAYEEGGARGASFRVRLPIAGPPPRRDSAHGSEPDSPASAR
jgi:two-component system, NtrC family, nitrogen regulation sensor histidine kinase NtrY